LIAFYIYGQKKEVTQRNAFYKKNRHKSHTTFEKVKKRHESHASEVTLENIEGCHARQTKRT
jgi:hypothetical protein